MDTTKPSTERLRQLAELLQQRIGLNSESVGKQTLQHAVEHRLKALRQTSADLYVSRLANDAGEWSEFLEEIIVPESWFFREATPFQCVREFARQALARESRPRTLRFLSIPCSRGEEPYSLAISLLDAGLVPAQFDILACDLSERSLQFARRGRYRSIAFRETDAVCQRLARQYFKPIQEEFELHASVRDKVRFQQANLASPTFSVGLGTFDFIFCRNVLIYLTEEVRQRALACFKRMLAPGGLLYLGHSECRLGPQAGAVVWNSQFPAAFTWSTTTVPTPHLPAASLASAKAVNQLGAKVSVAASAELAQPNAPAVATALSARTTPIDSTTKSADSLHRAKQLADSGRLSEAESILQAMLCNQAPQADVYCLLGVIVQARGDFAQAESFYHKALFLEPDHLESLTHVLLLAKLRGDAKQLTNYQRRLDRLRHQGLKP